MARTIGRFARIFQLLDHIGIDIDVARGFVETNERAVEKAAVFGHDMSL